MYGASGAKEGTLLSLCGGSEEDVEFARPVLMAYSKGVMRVGPVGAGQLAKACNNLLHWVHCVSNYEALLLAKRYGVDAQRMREGVHAGLDRARQRHDLAPRLAAPVHHDFLEGALTKAGLLSAKR